MQPNNRFQEEGVLYRIDTGRDVYFAEFTPKADVRVFNRHRGEPYSFRMRAPIGATSYFPLYVNSKGEIYDDNGKLDDVKEVSPEEMARELKRNGPKQQSL